MANKESVARAIARRYGGTYNRGKGPDIRTDKVTINVEGSRTLRTASMRLRGFRGPVYIALVNDADADDASSLTAGKTVGIMNSEGRVLKPSTRRHWP